VQKLGKVKTGRANPVPLTALLADVRFLAPEPRASHPGAVDQNTRDVARALVDLYSGYAASENDAEEHRAFDTAMERLNDAEGVIATMGDEGDLKLDFTPILTASNVILMWALDNLTEATDTTEEVLLFDLREFLARVGL